MHFEWRRNGQQVEPQQDAAGETTTIEKANHLHLAAAPSDLEAAASSRLLASSRLRLAGPAAPGQANYTCHFRLVPGQSQAEGAASRLQTGRAGGQIRVVGVEGKSYCVACILRNHLRLSHFELELELKLGWLPAKRGATKTAAGKYLPASRLIDSDPQRRSINCGDALNCKAAKPKLESDANAALVYSNELAR